MVCFSTCKLHTAWPLLAVSFLGSQGNAYAVNFNELAAELKHDTISKTSSRQATFLAMDDHQATPMFAGELGGVTTKLDEANLKVERLYIDGMKHRAIRLWQHILASYPAYLPAKYNLATAYFNERRFKAAAEQYFQIVEKDTLLWKYPDARYLGPLAYYRQFATIQDLHADYLKQYLVSDAPTFRKKAEKLRLLAIDRIISKSVDDRIKGRIEMQLAKSNRNIVHFWAEWCNPCIKELQQIFKFSLQNPDITYVVVSVDTYDDKVRADRRLNDLFSPYKVHQNHNIRFFHDAGRELWKLFIPEKDQETPTVPKTVFLQGTNLVAYSPQQIAWEQLDLLSIWGQ